MGKSYARNGTTVRPCVHCYLCHGDKLLGLPRARDVRARLDDIEKEIERYWDERDEEAERVCAGLNAT